MKTKRTTASERKLIQKTWSDSERKLRRQLAGEKQLQLKQLIVLTALASQTLHRKPALQPAYQQA